MSGTRVVETARRFGDGGHLVGIVTEPRGRERGRVVLVTAGLTPKYGPFRLYAELARRLAEDGLRVLRFDLGGIGDSAQAHGALPLSERTRLELRAGVDLLGGGPGGLTLAGLCSGAEDSLRYAAVDERVTGLALIDAFAYRTFGWRWRDAAIRAARRGLQAASLIPSAAADAQAGLVDYRHMERPECLRLLDALIARGVRMHFLYTGGMRESFNHRKQFEAMLADVDFRGLATVDFFPQLRHTQVLEHDRRLVIDSIVRALAARGGPCPS